MSATEAAAVRPFREAAPLASGWSIAILAIAAFVIVTTEFLIVGLIPDLARDLRVSTALAGQLVALFAFTVMLFGPLLTMLVAHLDRKRLFTVILLIFAGSNALAAIAPNIWVLGVARFIPALALPVFWGTASDTASRIAGPASAGRAVSQVYLGISGALLFGIPIGTLTANSIGWRNSFWSLAALSLLMAGLIAFFMPRIERLQRVGIADQLGILEDRRFVGNVVLSILVFTAMFTAYTYLADTLERVAGVAPREVGWWLMGFGTIGLVGNWIGGRTVDRNPLRATTVFTLILAAGMVLSTLAAATVIPFVAALAVWGIAYTALFPVCQTRHEGRRQRGSPGRDTQRVGRQRGYRSRGDDRRTDDQPARPPLGRVRGGPRRADRDRCRLRLGATENVSATGAGLNAGPPHFAGASMFSTQAHDFGKRDRTIRVNSYTTVRRRTGVPHDLFDAYWRDVHGPLCARLPGLGWYVQHHFAREHDAHPWPLPDGVVPFDDYVLDGMVEIGFASASDQATFKVASPLLFSDEQNIFDESVAYDLPDGSTTFVDRLVDPVPNGAVTIDSAHLHFQARRESDKGFEAYMADYAESLSTLVDVLKVRLHLPSPHDNAEPSPPAPDVEHAVPRARVSLAMIEIAFADPLTRRRVLATPAFEKLQAGQAQHVGRIAAFRTSGIHTYIRDGELTTAGLRGSRAAELIRALGAINQVQPEVIRLMKGGALTAAASPG